MSALEDILETARKRFKQASEAWEGQRKRDKEALRFQVPELQWSDQARAERAGTIANGVPIPARPCLAVSKLDQPIRMVENQARNAHLGVNVHPITPEADDDTAEVLQDIYRRIQRDPRAQEARLWAYGRAVRAGLGWYRLNTAYDKYATEGPEAFDQDIEIGRILYQEAVYVDPASIEPDFSDMGWLFVEEWVPAHEFKKKYPGVEPPEENDGFEPEDESDPSWVKDDGDTKAVRVCEYWYKEKTFADVEYQGQKRKRESCEVWWGKVAGSVWVEKPQQWNGAHIPFIPVIGRELQPIDGRRRWDGIIGPNMDAQRAYNYALSGAVEAAALEPKAPFIGYAEQFEGHEEAWQQSNIRNFAYLPVKAITVGGQAAPHPQRAQVDASRMQINIGLAQTMGDGIQAGTMMYDPSLGRPNGTERSGKAIQLQQAQGTEATSDFLANLADISLRREAEIVLDLIPAIYDRPGRIARLMDEQENTSAVMLGQPFVLDPRTKQPVPANENQPNAKNYDLSKGRYAVAVSVGRSWQTKMEQGAEEIGRLLEAHPELFMILGDLWLRYRDYPGAKDMADRMSKVREKREPGLTRKEGEAPDPEQVAAENEHLKGQLQEMGQALQQLQQEIQTDAAKQQATVAKAQIDGQTKLAEAQIDSDTRLKIAAMEAKIKSLADSLQHRHEDTQADKDVQRDAARTATEMLFKPPDLTPRVGSAGKPLSADKGRV